MASNFIRVLGFGQMSFELNSRNCPLPPSEQNIAAVKFQVKLSLFCIARIAQNRRHGPETLSSNLFSLSWAGCHEEGIADACPIKT